MPRASVDDVRKLNGFPDETAIADESVELWLEMRAGELDMLLVRRGVALPLTEPSEPSAPAYPLWHTLKMAESYGAAAMLETAPIVGKPITGDSVNLYMQEYTRLYNQIAALTEADLVRFGVLTEPSLTSTGTTVGGFSLVGNRRIKGLSREDWRGYPFREP